MPGFIPSGAIHPQVFINPHSFGKKKSKYIADSLWFYHKSTTAYKWNMNLLEHRILEESLTSLEDKLSQDFQYLKVNIGCELPIK